MDAYAAVLENSAGDGPDWQRFLARQDPIWERLPRNWWEAPFLGNGMLGTTIRQDGAKSMRWDIDRCDVQEHRPVSDGGALWARTRLPIGYFSLVTVGTIVSGTMRLDLWNAEATGEIVTDRGSIKFRSFVHSGDMVILTAVSRSGGEGEACFEWHALEAICPRVQFHPLPAGYQANPPFTLAHSGEVQTCHQSLVHGGETTVAWNEASSGASTTLFVSVAHTYPSAGSDAIAIDAVNQARKQDLDAFAASHRAWWHQFYPASFLSIPDPYWESFYWIQMYKMASATREDRALIDNQGPWLQPTPWPGAWWNLNVQLTYWPMGPANHPELSESLTRHLEDNVTNLIANVPQPYASDSAAISTASGQDLRSVAGLPGTGGEVANLTWALQNAWEHYRLTLDDKRLRSFLYPLLQRSVNYSLHFLQPDEQGVLHMPNTYSPEYGAGPDCTYTLALLRWGLHTLIKCSVRLGVDETLRQSWRVTLANLAPYPTDDTGYLIARGVPLAHGHRHFSHLLQVFPLHIVHAGQVGAAELVEKTVDHWQSMGERLGYSFTGASLMSSAFGRGNSSLDYLNGLKHFLQANTLYKEAGPVIETPLSAARAIQEMLIQSWASGEEMDGLIRIFPAVPDSWADAAFSDMRAEGAFLISAVRKNGVTEFVRVKSLEGAPCRICPALQAPVSASGALNGILTEASDGVFSLPLKKGEEVVLYTRGNRPSTSRPPVCSNGGGANIWGLKATAN